MISNEKKHTLIHFHAAWCSPCQTMEPIIDRIEKEFERQLQILKVDVDELEQFAQYFKVQNVPTFVLIEAENILWKQAGILTFAELKKVISEHLSRNC
ncbi:MAG: thioredoxin family protein [Crocinitomicaceae bacterium]|nr:thioredoxin family protein [Crocinitomicaceae bacterium]